MAGQKYAAGGIRSTVAATRTASDDDLRERLQGFLAEMLAQGTTTVEIKSGYGLDVATEERLVRLAAEVTPEVTFLGAHVVPAEYADRGDDYVDLVTGEMLDACAPHAKWIDVFCETGAFTVPQSRRVLEAGIARGLQPRVHASQLGPGEGVQLAVDLVIGPMLDACAPHAKWVDVFCETGAFTVEQSRRVLEAGIAKGLAPRVHASQLGPGAGIQLAIEVGAASVDHGTYLTETDIAALAASDTVLTLLPGVEFSTRQPYPDARRLIDAGVTVALACDTNPGSSFTSSMPFCIAVAVRDMGMTTAEAVWAATAGGAAALRRDDVGVIAAGMRADLVLLDAPTRVHLAYRPGVPLVAQVWKDGIARLE